MNTGSTRWALYNSRSKDQIVGLTLDEARVILSKVSDDLRPHWFAWKNGWADWTPVNHVTEFASAKPASSTAKSKAPDKAAAATEAKDRRKHERFKIQMRVVIVSENGHAFRSSTRDISKGGMLLAHPIPEKVASGTCEFYISNPEANENLRFSGRIIESSDARRRVQFKIEDHELETKLGELLIRLNEQSKLKKAG